VIFHLISFLLLFYSTFWTVPKGRKQNSGRPTKPRSNESENWFMLRLSVEFDSHIDSRTLIIFVLVQIACDVTRLMRVDDLYSQLGFIFSVGQSRIKKSYKGLRRFGPLFSWRPRAKCPSPATLFIPRTYHFPFGFVVRPTQGKWNHSMGHYKYRKYYSLNVVKKELYCIYREGGVKNVSEMPYKMSHTFHNVR
jgi:hypothetical protein